ncbi:hypothetical protein [Saccharothrix deserti]|uniref:hypothetical protein n=1 Tax=Saccharothrix deserti TaxID=2593674 RepID=UPI00131D682A|nr:hypothetical protein [Saccharothrix deserti]
MRNAATGALIALFAITGCSAEPAASPSAAPTSTTVSPPPTTTSATPVALSKDEAARRYLTIVKPYNLALEHLEQGINAGRPIADVRALADATARANRTHVAELRAVVWPADVVPAMTTLLAEADLAQPHWERAALAPTVDAVVEAVKAAIAHDGSDAAATIRTLLALDQYDERDYP